jgi:hypothetical protein
MSVNVMATLRKAVRERGLLGSLDRAKGGAARARRQVRIQSRPRRRRMSASARRALSQRMKAHWAKRRAGSAKSKSRAAAARR